MVRKEIYHHSEYLLAFADRLANAGNAKRRERKWETYFKCSHPNLNGFEIIVKRPDLGIGHAVGCDTTLKGTEEQISEFIRAAGSYLDNVVDSKRCVERHLKNR